MPAPPARYDPAVRTILGLVVAGLLLVTACSAKSETALPDGPALLKRSAEAMRTVKTVAFTIETKDKPAVPVRHAEGSLTREGDAKGTLQIEIAGLQEIEFVLVGDKVYFKGPTGGFQTMTRQQLMALYNPSAVLTGVPDLLSTAKDVQTQAEEKGFGRQHRQLAGVAPGQNRNEPAIAQLCHHKAPCVPVRAEHRHRETRSHRFSSYSNDPL